MSSETLQHQQIAEIKHSRSQPIILFGEGRWDKVVECVGAPQNVFRNIVKDAFSCILGRFRLQLYTVYGRLN